MTYTPEVEARLRDEAQQIIDRYPTGHERSALLPMLHLVQSEDGYVSADGIALCADVLDITRAEVSAVATFYTQYKRHPNGDYLVGVCTNSLCAVMGGDEIWEAVSEHVGVGSDETSPSGKITLERLECNAACDYAPVIMVNWEFFDNQTVESAIALVDALEAGRPVSPTRGPDTVATFKENERVLAGFPDGRVHEGPSAGEASLLGLKIADTNGWTAPTPIDSADTTDHVKEGQDA
ncbi:MULTISPECIES: NADH-quinone oxidoreductase subunit NuoE [unclassified Schaalia]|uniref:NADH-quinone oxidoreductase subunit NuoE n=1 Tax=unclassified Schaalia TaxID=2691889 RepID=UPI001E360170|nr:NADH-quinone oxidoreductase subunit NuoE [Schaalia sp. lx-260]MCD4557305.1 NADH-quinone oxidoreductase subunit NuoE [Schaalia sp. lx-100]